MDSQNGSQGGVRERSNGRHDGEIWGAKDSLKRNAGMNKISSDEITPLLDSGSGSSEGDGEDQTETVWAGYADFEGVTWWHKPSVGITIPVAGFKLICVDALVNRPLLPPHACDGRYLGP